MKKKFKPRYYKGMIFEADERTPQNRIYPRNVVEKAIDDFYKKKAEGTVFFGGVDPQAKFDNQNYYNISNSSHIVEHIMIDKNDKVYAIIKTLSTPLGKTIPLIAEYATLTLDCTGNIENPDNDTHVITDMQIFSIDLMPNSLPDPENTYSYFRKHHDMAKLKRVSKLYVFLLNLKRKIKLMKIF